MVSGLLLIMRTRAAICLWGSATWLLPTDGMKADTGLSKASSQLVTNAKLVLIFLLSGARSTQQFKLLCHVEPLVPQEVKAYLDTVKQSTAD